jgi:hypothetical protein
MPPKTTSPAATPVLMNLVRLLRQIRDRRHQTTAQRPGTSKEVAR